MVADIAFVNGATISKGLTSRFDTNSGEAPYQRSARWSKRRIETTASAVITGRLTWADSRSRPS